MALLIGTLTMQQSAVTNLALQLQHSNKVYLLPYILKKSYAIKRFTMATVATSDH